MIERSEALKLVEARVSNVNMVHHMLAVEAVMRSLARHLGEDEELWGVTGLLHDLDTPETVDDFPRHGYLTAEMLADKLPEKALHAIKVHPGHIPAETTFDWALYCADPVTGLITAATLVHPSRQLAQIKLKSLKKRFKDKRFAAGADREIIKTCDQIGLELSDFLALSLEAMQGIADQLGF
ncbi:MAG: HD domain-containing protein [Candidatus Electryoneaceae bacterium]|nr:HD domain-containing protein [Candidatus Electryoneaceae bacterium]